ncbi:hypothetical protein ES702_04112 [subsurface metagenome]
MMLRREQVKKRLTEKAIEENKRLKKLRRKRRRRLKKIESYMDR